MGHRAGLCRREDGRGRRDHGSGEVSVAGMIDEAVELYGVDPSGFVAARTALVRELKAAKRKDEAAAVAKLTRPKMGEYTLNRVAREEPDVVEAFAAAVAAATSAQSNAIGSGDG